MATGCILSVLSSSCYRNATSDAVMFRLGVCVPGLLGVFVWAEGAEWGLRGIVVACREHVLADFIAAEGGGGGGGG